MKRHESSLVTYCLFSYNQENFIREAVESALSQNYFPLEIIISDDCSNDRTYDIIQDIVHSYKGPHKVFINRNNKNLGISGHVEKVFSMAHGELLIMAAGDDVSLPDRTKIFVENWLPDKEKIFAIVSSTKSVDVYGNEIDSVFKIAESHANFNYNLENPCCGASAAYSMKLYKIFGGFSKLCPEDKVFFHRAWLLGGIYFIKNELVIYRRGSGLSSCQIDYRKGLQRYNAWNYYAAVQLISDISKLNFSLSSKKLEQAIAYKNKFRQLYFLSTGKTLRRILAFLRLTPYLDFYGLRSHFLLLFPEHIVRLLFSTRIFMFVWNKIKDLSVIFCKTK